MSDYKATTELIVNGDKAKAELEIINKQIAEVDKQLRKARKDGDQAMVDQLKKQKNQLTANRNALQKEAIEVNRILNNLSTAKPKELNSTIRQLTKMMNDPSIKRGGKEWQYLSDSVKRCKTELASVNSELQIGQSGWKKFTSSVNLTGIGAIIGGITGITLAMGKFQDERDKLESSSANLKALTGLDDAQVDWMTEQATKLSESKTEDGVRITQTANDIVNAFTLVGSQRPELLKDSEALKQVTEDAILLSIASKGDLEPSARALTTVLNQFNLTGNDSGRVINALGAGAQAGAADIAYLSEAVEKSGTTANTMNLSFEQHLALIEAVAPKYSEASVAGNSLDKVLQKMKEKNIGYVNGIFDINKALDDLKLRFNNGETATSVFGAEHAKMAEILVQSKNQFNEYASVITGTNKAIEQAVINSNTEQAESQQRKNEIMNQAIALLNEFRPLIELAEVSVFAFLKVLLATPTAIKENVHWLGSIAVVIALFNKDLIASTSLKWADIAVDKVKIIWTKALTVAQVALNTAMKANPITLVLSAVAMLIAAYISWYNESVKVQAFTQGIWAALKQFGVNVFDLAKALINLNLIGLLLDPSSAKDKIQKVINTFKNFGSSIADAYTNAYNDRMNKADKNVEINPNNTNTPSTSALDKDLQELESSLNSKRLAIDKYQEENLEEKKKYELKQLKFELDGYQQRKSILLKHQQDTADIDNKILIKKREIQKKQEEVNKSNDQERKKQDQKQKKEQDEALKYLDNHFEMQAAIIKRQQLEHEESEKLFQFRLERNELAHLEAKKFMLMSFGKDVGKIESEIMDKRIAIIKEKQKSLEYRNYAIVRDEEEEEDLDLLNKMEAWKRTYNVKHAMLVDELNKGLITQAEFYELERDLQEEHLEKMLSKKMEYTQMAGDIAYQASQLVDALQNKEMISIENKYAKEIKAAAGNKEKQQQLQEQMEEEKKQVKKKYADIDFAITAAGIVADTAAAIMQLWVKPGFPAAIPLAALVGATGIAQIAVANEQRQQIKNLWTGGFTGSGGWDEPKGIVHSDEFVGNRFAVRNTPVRKLFNYIDIAQRNNTIGNVTEYDLMNALGGRPIATGGGNDEAMLLMYQAVQSLTNSIKEGTLAKTYITGYGGINEAQTLYNKMKNNVTR